jgi:hypothetical protein
MDIEDIEEDNEDIVMNKLQLLKLLNRMTILTRQALACNPKLAQEYYEKVQHLSSAMRLVTNFERQLLVDLDVD